jgi:hypothetical protein
MMLPETLFYSFLYKGKGKFLEVTLLSHLVAMRLTFLEVANLFP